jgi:hypothetical protein
MFFQEATPDTSGYMIAGYAIAFIVMGLYVASMYLRSRNLKQDMSMLEEMDKPAAPKVEPKAASKPAGAKKTQTVTKMSTKK